MKCPYCGQYVLYKSREHFFPKSIVYNEWDFKCCRRCNTLKGDRIIYPADYLFKVEQGLSLKVKFVALWKQASIFNKLLCLSSIQTLQVAINESIHIMKLPTYKFSSIECKALRLYEVQQLLQDLYINHLQVGETLMLDYEYVTRVSSLSKTSYETYSTLNSICVRLYNKLFEDDTLSLYELLHKPVRETDMLAPLMFLNDSHFYK